MHFRKKTVALLLVAISQSAVLTCSEGESRALALLTLGDHRAACLEAEGLVRSEPASKSAWSTYLKALSKSGNEKKLLRTLQECHERFPDDRELLEVASWGVIEAGARSPSPLIRLYSCIGAFMGQDARSVSVLREAMHDSSPEIRAIAVQLASNYRDHVLQDEVYSLLLAERNPRVRVEAIKAAGKMKIRSAEQTIVAILVKPGSLAEERGAAMESLVNLMDVAQRSEILHLAHSKRAGLREFACRAVSHTFDKENADAIVPLLRDHCCDVRRASAMALGLLQLDVCGGVAVEHLLSPLLHDPDPITAVSAAWALTFYRPEQPILSNWLTHPKKEVRHFAAGALAATGSHGVPQMKEHLSLSSDPYVRVNLAVGLIAQREDVEVASDVVSRFLERTRERVAWETQGHIRYLTSGQVKPHPLIPNRPETVNLSTRLELLNLLALIDDPGATEAVRDFLQKRPWGVSGLAAALLLTEGDEESLEVVEQLLSDPDQKIRIQAALTLALWGRGENAVAALQEAYQGADREVKEKILESLGRVGSESSIPFLVNALDDPSQTMRIVAASSLLLCLYH